jgi:hypothetical protein
VSKLSRARPIPSASRVKQSPGVRVVAVPVAELRRWATMTRAWAQMHRTPRPARYLAMIGAASQLDEYANGKETWMGEL